MDAADRYILVGALATFASTVSHRLAANDSHDPSVSRALQGPRIPFTPAYRFRVWLSQMKWKQ